MISTTKKAEHVVSDGLAGERRAFTIKATGKAFRTLIDGLYENKIGAVVREIMSNAYDSHAAAGLSDVPISVTAPTSMDPTFRVRDYGVSMTHEDVMDLYSTIFESTKESTNEQVGMFGLGSKSPFAYTDTFSVTAWKNGEKRVYVAHISDDDVPQITHVVTEPGEDQPQGIEVAVPVQPNDAFRFQAEITRMVFGSDVTPILDGMGSMAPKILVSGDGWRIVPDSHHMGRMAVRQGCVIYPVSRFFASSVSYGYTVVVDVPIGSVEVTASRESLSLTPETEDFIRDRTAEVDTAIRAWAEGIEFENRLDEYNKNNEYEFLSFGVGRSRIDLQPDKRQPVPGNHLVVYTSKRKTKNIYQVEQPEKLVLIVDNGEKVLRRNLRLGAYYAGLVYGTKMAVVAPADVPRLVRILGLKPSQVRALSSLPDVQVQRSGVSGGYRSGGEYAAPDAMPSGKFWIEKTGVKTLEVMVGDSWVKHTDYLFIGERRVALTELGFKPDDVVFFTQRQAEKLGVVGKHLFLDELKVRAEAYAEDTDLQERLDADATSNVFNRFNNRHTMADYITSQFGMNRYDHRNFFEAVTTLAVQGLNDDQPEDVVIGSTDRFVAGILELSGTSSLSNADLGAKVKSLVEAVSPLVGGAGDPMVKLLKSYINNNIQEGESE